MSDDERREVAKALRKLDVSDLGDERNIIDTPEDSGVLFNRMLDVANDYRAGLHYFPSHFKARDAVELFADLIEPEPERTCTMEFNEGWSGDELYPTSSYTCSECGWITLEGKPNYCPNCGTKVVE